MSYDEIIEKNITHSFEFSLYVMQHPEFTKQIPLRAAFNVPTFNVKTF